MREDWIESELGELCQINMGQSPPSSSYNTDGDGLPFFQGKAEFTDLYPVVRKWCNAPKKIAEKDDILLSVRAPVGTTNIANQKCSIGRGLSAIKYSQCSRYVFYYLRLIERRLDDLGTGTTFKAISGGILKSQKIDVAPLPEQRAIVAKIEQLFSELDNGIANLKAAKAKLAIYRQAVLKKAFEGELTKEWRGKNDIERNRRKNNSAQNDSNNKPCSPNGWEWKKFEEITLNFDGKRRPLSRAIRANFKGEYPYYGACEIIDHVKEYIFDGEYLLIGEDGANLLSKSKPLAFVATGKFWVNNHAHIVQTKGNHDIGFLMHQFNSLQINQYVTGTAQPKLSQRNLNKIPIAVCSLEEQNQVLQEIETRLSVCDNILRNIEESLEKAEALRQSILKKAFEGKLLNETELAACRQQPDWQPADKLLARIKQSQN